MVSTLDEAITRFGKTAKDKLNNPGATGQPEDQLRAPLETLVADLCALIRPAADDVVLVGESALSELMTRPDYAVTRKNALVGHIEVKAPGKGGRSPAVYRQARQDAVGEAQGPAQPDLHRRTVLFAVA